MVTECIWENVALKTLKHYQVNEYNFNLIVTDFFGGQVSKNVRFGLFTIQFRLCVKLQNVNPFVSKIMHLFCVHLP